MTVREFVVKLVLDAVGFRNEVDRAQGELAQLGATARETGTRAASALDDAAHSAAGLADSARSAGAQAAASMDNAADKAATLGDQARDAGQSLQHAAQRGGRGFDALLGTLGKVAGVLGGLAAIKGAVTAYVGAVSDIERTSDMLGMSMDAWQGWAHAAKEAGLEAEDVRDRLMDLGDWMLDLNVNDSGPLKDFAEKTKTSFKDASGATVSMEEGLLRLADASQKMDRQQATSWLQQIGFDEKTTPLILKGRKAIEEYIRVGKEQALYSKRDAENARKLREAWQGVERVYASLSGAILRALGPVFDWLAEKAGGLARWVREHEDSLTLFITALSAVIGRALIPALWGMSKAAWAAVGPLRPFITIGMALAAVLDDLWAFISGGNSVLEKIMRSFGATSETINSMRQAARDVLAALGELWDFLTGQGDVPSWLDNMIPDWLKSVFSGGRQAAAAGIGGAGVSAPGADEDDPVLAAQAAARATTYRAGDAARPAGSVSNSRHVETHIGQITVNTQATDADAIGRDIGGALQNQVAQADGANGV